jgi:hypothetical protein
VTRTEDRLTDALGAVAERIPDDSLPPLSASRRPAALRWERAARWLVPVSVAAAVLAVVGGVALVVPGIGSAGPFADLGTRSSPPPYYVSVDDSDRIVVHSTSSGAMTDAIPQPGWLSGGNSVDTAIVASKSGRTFVAAMNDWDTQRTRLYRFSLTSAGKIAGLSAPRMSAPGLTRLSAALSPDGSEVALAGVPDAGTIGLESAGPPRVLLVSLKTGHVRTWTMPAKPGGNYLIQDPSWSADGRALYFLADYCRGGRVPNANAVCSYNWPVGREWMLPVPAGGTTLGRARSTAKLPAGTSQAMPVPGNELVAFSATNQNIVVGRYTMSGRRIRVLYRGRPRPELGSAYLSTDASGRYVIVNEDRSTVFGWVSGGRIHDLSTRWQFGFDEMLSTAW